MCLRSSIVGVVVDVIVGAGGIVVTVKVETAVSVGTTLAAGAHEIKINAKNKTVIM